MGGRGPLPQLRYIGGLFSFFRRSGIDNRMLLADPLPSFDLIDWEPQNRHRPRRVWGCRRPFHRSYAACQRLLDTEQESFASARLWFCNRHETPIQRRLLGLSALGTSCMVKMPAVAMATRLRAACSSSPKRSTPHDKVVTSSKRSSAVTAFTAMPADLALSRSTQVFSISRELAGRRSLRTGHDLIVGR